MRIYDSAVKSAYCSAGRSWHTPLIPALRRQRQADLSEFEASLVYRASSRTARTVKQRKSCFRRKQKTKQKATTTRKRAYCSCRVPRFSSQNSLPKTAAPGALTPSLVPHRHCTHPMKASWQADTQV